MDQPLLLRLAAVTRDRPFVVDAALAGAVVLFTVLYPARISAYYPDQVAAALIGLLLTVPLAWRRRAPVPAAAVVVAAGLLELATTSSFLAANVAALAMVYSLAAYAPRWAVAAGLAVGLLGAALAALPLLQRRHGSSRSSWPPWRSASPSSPPGRWATCAGPGCSSWPACRSGRRLLELERDQEMRLAATTERARIAREMHDVVAHSLSVVIAQADGGRYAGQADPAAATEALDADLRDRPAGAHRHARRCSACCARAAARSTPRSPTSPRSTSWSPTCGPAGWTST